MNKKGSRFLQIIIIISLAVIAQIQVFSVLAQASNNTDKCRPLDLVILIDESQSMFQRNDINGRRYDAANTIIDYLGNHAIFLCREDGIQHRVSIIGFGDQANAALNGDDNNYREDTVILLDTVVIPNQIISDKDIKEATTIWEAERKTIIASTSHLGATDHRSAFNTTQDILFEWESEPLGTAERRKAIILLTDGGSCVRNLGCNDTSLQADANELGNTAKILMSELEEMLKPTGEMVPFYGAGDPDSVYVATVFLSNDLQRESFGTLDTWEKISTDHGGDLYPITRSTSLVATINDALDPISGSGRTPVECGSPVWVRPYLDNVVIFSAYPLVDNPTEQATVVITDTANNRLYGIRGGIVVTGTVNIDNVFYHSYKGNETYIIDAPIPGAYQVFVGDADDCTDALSIKKDAVAINSGLDSPSRNMTLPTVENEPYYSDYVNSTFALYITDTNGIALQENSDYPLEVTAVVKNDEHNYEKTYNLIQIKDGFYESSFIETPYPGNYTWSIYATVRHPNAAEEAIDIFQDADPPKPRPQGQFTASPVTLLTFDIDAPSNGDVFPLNRVNGISQIPEKFDVAITVTSSNGSINVNDILTSLDGLFTAELLNGTASLGTITLQPDPVNPNRFVGQFTNGSIDNLFAPGNHTIKVTTNWGGTENYDKLTHAPTKYEAITTITQYEIKPVQLELISPQQVLLHQQDTLLKMFLKQNGLQPFPVFVRVIDPLNENKPQFLSDVLSSLDGFDVVVEAPSGITQTITLAKSPNVAEELLVGSGGEFLDERGEYTLSIRVVANQLHEEYAWAQTSYEATFIREDSNYTSRATWTGAQIVVGIIVLIIIGRLIYIFSGGPTGSLVIVNTGTNPKQELVTLTLRKYRRVNKFKKSVFKQVGIEQITAQKGDGNFVSVHVKQADGLDAPLGEMEPGEISYLGNAEIRYVNDRVVATSYDDFE